MKRIKGFTDRTFLILSVLLMLSLSSCEKYDLDITGDINFYLLEEYETEGIRGLIKDEGIVLNDEPVIPYSELLEYNSDNHSFKLQPATSERIKDLLI